jgi:hypothetical protein
MESVAIAGILVYILVLITVFVVGILGTVFWIWMLVDCATKERGEGNDKLIWVLIILFITSCAAPNARPSSGFNLPVEPDSDEPPPRAAASDAPV